MEEEILNPDLPICDTHHHLRERPNDRYLVEEFLADAGSGHRIVKSVFIQSKTMYRQECPPEMQPVGETEFIEHVTARTIGQNGTEVAAGIVGSADLMLGAAVALVLEAHIAAGNRRFRGIRPNQRAVDGWLDAERRFHGVGDSRPWREGFACLEKYGLSLDIIQTHTHLTDLANLIRDFPALKVIVNHLGMPFGIGPASPKREDVLAEWRRGLTALVSCPNVVMKLGGLGMASFGFGWHERAKPPTSVELAEAMAPPILECIEKFGVGRCMFESNFPVDRVSYSYAVMWNAFERVVRDFSASEKAALFYDTAAKTYRLRE